MRDFAQVADVAPCADSGHDFCSITGGGSLRRGGRILKFGNGMLLGFRFVVSRPLNKFMISVMSERFWPEGSA